MSDDGIEVRVRFWGTMYQCGICGLKAWVVGDHVGLVHLCECHPSSVADEPEPATTDNVCITK